MTTAASLGNERPVLRVAILLGMRLVVPYAVALLVLFVVLAAIFAWRAFNAPVPYGFA